MPPPHSGYRWWILTSVFVTNVLVSGFGWSYVIMVPSAIVEDLGVTFEKWGLLWGGISFGAFLFSIPAGALADRFGVRHVVGASLGLAGASLLLRAQVNGLVPMVACMVLFGLAVGSLFSNLPKALGIWFPREELGLANGVGLAGYGAGFTLVGFATVPLVEAFGGWRELTWVLGWGVLSFAVLWLLSVRDRAAPQNSEEISTLAGMGRVLRERDVWIPALCYGLYNAGYLGATGYLVTFLMESKSLSEQAAGTFIATTSWTFVVGSLILPALSDRVGRRRVVYLVGMALVAATVSLLATTRLPLIPLAVSWGFFTGGLSLLFTIPLEVESVGPRLGGSAAGLISTIGFAGGFDGPVIGLALADLSPTLGLLFWAGCYLASSALIVAARETGYASKPSPAPAASRA